MQNINFSKLIFMMAAFILSNTVTAGFFKEETTYQACFTPGQQCTRLIADKIYAAKDSVYVQAASFTSTPIARAIVNAKRRGLDVVVILDRSQIKTGKYSLSKYFMNNDVPVYIDYKPAIAHNKVIIIDKNIVITGSFNFTKAAQYWNAENVLMIANQALAEKYLNNWKTRLNESVKAQDYYKVSRYFDNDHHDENY